MEIVGVVEDVKHELNIAGHARILPATRAGSRGAAMVLVAKTKRRSGVARSCAQATGVGHR